MFDQSIFNQRKLDFISLPLFNISTTKQNKKEEKKRNNKQTFTKNHSIINNKW